LGHIPHAAGAPATSVRAWLVRFRRAAELEILYEGGSMGRDGWARESVSLEVARGGGTRVERTIEFHDPRIPFWLRLLAGYLMRFGNPKGESDLDAVARVAAV